MSTAVAMSSEAANSGHAVEVNRNSLIQDFIGFTSVIKDKSRMVKLVLITYFLKCYFFYNSNIFIPKISMKDSHNVKRKKNIILTLLKEFTKRNRDIVVSEYLENKTVLKAVDSNLRGLIDNRNIIKDLIDMELSFTDGILISSNSKIHIAVSADSTARFIVKDKYGISDIFIRDFEMVDIAYRGLKTEEFVVPAELRGVSYPNKENNRFKISYTLGMATHTVDKNVNVNDVLLYRFYTLAKEITKYCSSNTSEAFDWESLMQRASNNIIVVK